MLSKKNAVKYFLRKPEGDLDFSSRESEGGRLARAALKRDSLPAEPIGKPKNTGMGSLSLLWGIFPTQELNQGPHIAG